MRAVVFDQASASEKLKAGFPKRVVRREKMAAELRVTRLGREPFQHGPVDRRRPEVLNLAAECHLRVFKRSVAQLFCTQGLRVFANAMFDVVAVEAKFAPFTVD